MRVLHQDNQGRCEIIGARMTNDYDCAPGMVSAGDWDSRRMLVAGSVHYVPTEAITNIRGRGRLDGPCREYIPADISVRASEYTGPVLLVPLAGLPAATLPSVDNRAR